MSPRVLTMLACVPLLAALAILTLSTARAAPVTPAPSGPAGSHTVNNRLATGAGALIGAAIAIAIIRRAPRD
ncbi:MAG TPA: hypothetical protein VGL93_03765 [Streptosporangiaceae bacterium]|jgi:hypothetical protein